MNPYTVKASLVLHASPPAWQPSRPDDVAGVLRDCGLIAAAIEDQPYAYYCGERFLELIAFMGCSPAIRFAPEPDAETFCYVQLQSTPGHISARTSPHSHAPICPQCSKAVKNWHELISDDRLCCGHCGCCQPPWDYNWRKSAGFATFFIEITDIYPKEAIPQQSLLDRLADYSGTRWQYFYHHP